MIRGCSALRLFVAALAIGALAPLGAQAKVGFQAPRDATLEGTRSGHDVFTTAGIARECDEVTYKGAVSDPQTLGLVPIYAGCVTKAFAGLPSKFVDSSCGYALHIEAGRAADGNVQASVDVACPSEYTLEWHAYETEQRYSGGDALCTTDVQPQTGLQSVELTEVGSSPSKIAIHWNLHRIAYKAYGSVLFCGSMFGRLQRNASYTGVALIEAKDAQGRPVDLSMSG